MELAGEPPGKVQFQVVGPPRLVSVNWMLELAHTFCESELKEAVTVASVRQKAWFPCDPKFPPVTISAKMFPKGSVRI